MGVPDNIEKAASCLPIGPHDGVDYAAKIHRDVMSVPTDFDRLDAFSQEDYDILSTVRLLY